MLYIFIKINKKMNPLEEVVETKKTKKINSNLNIYFDKNPTLFEVGVDEAGRGPLFGRVYTAAVILPKDETFDHFNMKDSKRFHSKKKIQEIAEYIKANAIAWSVTYEDEKTIDNINILQATQQTMHRSIHGVIEQHYKNNNIDNSNDKNSDKVKNKNNYKLLIDGNYFKHFTPNQHHVSSLDSVCIEGGDNKYTAIAAASILAKVARDQYIEDLCDENPELDLYYGIRSNKGYGAKKHLDGIKEHGISIWHRRSFGICKSYL